MYVDPHAYWTGYFTSRPALKFHERQANALLIAAKQAVVLAGMRHLLLPSFFLLLLPNQQRTPNKRENSQHFLFLLLPKDFCSKFGAFSQPLAPVSPPTNNAHLDKLPTELRCRNFF